MKVSDFIVRFFEERNVTDIFMVSGGGCMHLVDSFGRSKKIQYWCTHHEQAAAMAAEAYAKMKNNIGVALVTSGPGATNTVTGVLDCYQDSIPVVFLSGQSKIKQTIRNAQIEGLRQFGVQEADIVAIVEPITKYAIEVENPKKIRYYLEKAVYVAKNGRPGPVWLSIPLDVQSADIDVDTLEGYVPNEEKTAEVSLQEKDIAELVALFKAAKRPVIIAGHGVRLADSCESLDRFSKTNSIPVVMPFLGIDVLEDAHPCNIGRIGTKGTRAGNFAVQNADLILSLGSRLSVSSTGHDYESFAREAKIVVVDIDEREHLKKTIRKDKFIWADVREVLAALNTIELPDVNYKEWLSRCQEWKKRYPVVLPEYEDDSEGVNYYKFVDEINKYTTAKMPVISDAGSSFYVVAQAIALKKGQRHITTGGTATMGFCVPAAIGVAISNPDSTVIGITGEGSFMQNLQEMEVIRYHKLNAKIFVMDNGGYFSIHATQKRYFNGNFVGAGEESGLSFGNIRKFAEAFDVPYYYIQTIKECEKMIPEILEQKGPALIEVAVKQNMEIIPSTSSSMRKDGVMVSKPIEDMYPFLEREEFLKNMLVKPLSET